VPYTFEFGPVFAKADVILSGVWLTLWLSGIGILLGLALGVALAMSRGLLPRAVQAVVDGYVEVIRNTPFLIQLFMIFFGLPVIGIRLDAVEAAVLTITLNLGAYATEIIRAGIESIHPSQLEAGSSLAMTRLQVFRYVVLMPALAKVWPSLTSQFVLTLLSTSVCSFISVQELSGSAAQVETDTYRSFETYITVTIIYLGLSLLLRLILVVLGEIMFPRGSGLRRLTESRR
jgi:polar amino acid transport system permease protein